MPVGPSELLDRVTARLPGGGEARPGQRAMLDAVAAAIDAGRPLVVEAGTGTGKSLAYLVPAVASRRKAVVATATIALQDQLVGHDAPLVAAACDHPVTVALLKGRSNYLCRQRLDELDRASGPEQQDLLGGAATQRRALDRLRAWAGTTTTGDREELDDEPPPELWRAVSVGPDECPGAARCPAGDRCFAEEARRRAAQADIVVTNHHYYGLHIATGGTLLPPHDLVVFDEAHHLADVLGAVCGAELGGGRFRALARRAGAVLTGSDLPPLLERSADDLDAALTAVVGRRLTGSLGRDLAAALVTARDRADQVMAALRRAQPSPGSDAAARVERATVSASATVDAVDAVLGACDGVVRWVDGDERRPVLRVTPLDVALLIRPLWDEMAAVLTSATLPDGIVDQLGLPAGTEVRRVGSPFPYGDHALLYCAAHLPDPRSERHPPAATAELVELIHAAGGRTLALFTSHRAMQAAADVARRQLAQPVLCQGDLPRAALLARFRDEPATCLFATLGFWQGVDVPGETLSLVAIDRLPFPRPDEPVAQARREAAGADAFRLVDLPRAQILLAQAAGRLVRRADDRGVVAVLDPRLATRRSYRWELVRALPPMRRTRDRGEVLARLRQLALAAEAAGR
jgi:ATP-dependent DNA helicase DinG